MKEQAFNDSLSGVSRRARERDEDGECPLSKPHLSLSLPAPVSRDMGKRRRGLGGARPHTRIKQRRISRRQISPAAYSMLFCATGIMPHSVLMRCRIFHRFASNCSSSLPFSERLPNTKKPNWLRTIGTEMMFSLLQPFPLFLGQPALTYFEMHHASLSKPKGTI